MGQPIIVLGDMTSHGGTVVTAAISTDTYGKGWARVGDMVSCPRCKGVFPISQGDPGLIDDGKPVAYHGCKVACGATLISSQLSTATVPTSRAAGGTPSTASGDEWPAGFGSIGAEMIAAYQDEPVVSGDRYRGRFHVLDAATGAPANGLAVRVRGTGGQYVTCTTDADGFTRWVERDAAEALAFDLNANGEA